MAKLASITVFLLFLSSITFNNGSSNPDLQKKIIRQGNYDITFYVSLKKPGSFDIEKMYYWYKSGEIHYSQYSSGGLMLHSGYQKHYRSNQIAEEGFFNHGLKQGVWKNWYENGTIQHVQKWKNGLRDGVYISFDPEGNRTLKGQYRNNVKYGKWVNHKTNDTLFYEKGFIKQKDSLHEEGFFKRLFKKREVKKKKESTVRKKKDRTSEKKTKQETSFFKRLFKKKDKKAKKTS